MIKNLADIQKQIHHLNPQTKILAVSKLQSIEKIRALYLAGQRDFAENYVQEALDKQNQLQDLSITWHLIGNLQKNKVKHIVGRFSLIHSVDSLSLAQIIDRKAQELGLKQRVLLQLNLAEEETKGGFSKLDLEKALPELEKLSALQITGLMTMPPLFDDAEKARPYFRELRNLQINTQNKISTCTQLSMGTSSDYLVAAEEGSSIVRLGTILFGER